MKYTLIGGPNHGEIVELPNSVEVYEGTYHKSIADYLVHESLTELDEYEDISDNIKISHTDLKIETVSCDPFEQATIIKFGSEIIGFMISVSGPIMKTSLNTSYSSFSVVRYINTSILRD